jgi:hypothetical protein
MINTKPRKNLKRKKIYNITMGFISTAERKERSKAISKGYAFRKI